MMLSLSSFMPAKNEFTAAEQQQVSIATPWSIRIILFPVISPDRIKHLTLTYVSDNGQAKPAIYEIQKEDNRYFVVEAFKRLYISYDAVKDSISISYYGEYLRN